MIHVSFTDKLSVGQLTLVQNLVNNTINENVGLFRKRKDLVWLGEGAFLTPDIFEPNSLLVWLEGQLISPERLNGIQIISSNSFKFKLSSSVTETSLVTCYYNIAL